MSCRLCSHETCCCAWTATSSCKLEAVFQDSRLRRCRESESRVCWASGKRAVRYKFADDLENVRNLKMKRMCGTQASTATAINNHDHKTTTKQPQHMIKSGESATYCLSARTANPLVTQIKALEVITGTVLM
ncbi:unnamed protein product [Polarella glacialis]|uniref:Uncharacterized protein n=1 Tax=Polarella glacialis TaxID=89957 RepID=A0A813LJE6_POLGL|nr:unnamed protein product [Polarella glacialis]